MSASTPDDWWCHFELTVINASPIRTFTDLKNLSASFTINTQLAAYKLEQNQCPMAGRSLDQQILLIDLAKSAQRPIGSQKGLFKRNGIHG